MRKRDCALAGSLLFASGCTLAGLGEFDIGSCVEGGIDGRSPCRILDERDGIRDDACFHWQCSRAGRGCELRAKDYDADDHADSSVCAGVVDGADDCDDDLAERHGHHPEVPDGVDNDCDDVIDNHLHAPCLDAVEELDVTLPDTKGEIDLNRVEGASGRFVVTRNGRAVLVDPGDRRSTPITFDSQAAVAQSSTKPCPTPGGNQVCNLRELALASFGDTLVGAAVSDNAGCPRGEIRIGVGTAATAPILLWLGSSDRHESNLPSAVDRTEEHCPELGARSPAIAGLSNAGFTQALSVWVEGDAQSALSCGEEASVRALGLWVVTAEPAVVRATGGGVSQQIGRSRGEASPALIADVEGYIAGFGNARGDLELRFLDPLSSTPIQDAATPALQPSTSHTWMHGRGVDFVALEFGSTHRRMASAFRTGCDGSTEVGVMVFDLERSGPPRVDEIAEVQLDSRTRGNVLDGPHLVHVSSGFRWTARTRTSLGGWLVSWIVEVDGATELLAARVSEDGVLLDRAPFRVVSGLFDRVLGFADAGRVSYVGPNANRNVLERTTVLCSPD